MEPTENHQDNQGDFTRQSIASIHEFYEPNTNNQSLRPKKSEGLLARMLFETLDPSPGFEIIECQYCNKIFNFKNQFQTHICKSIGERLYECKYCQTFFPQAYQLYLHIRKHISERSYKCEYCPKSFTRLVQLQDHIQTHTDKRECQCKLCWKPFSNLSGISENIRTFPLRSCDYGAEMNYRAHPPKPEPLDTSRVNGNVYDNKLNGVNGQESNVVVYETNDFNNNVDKIAIPVDVQPEDLNFASPENSLDTRLAMQTSPDPTSNPPMIGLPQPPEQSLSSPSQLDHLALHRMLYEEWESSFSAYTSTSNSPPSLDPFQDLCII